MGTAIEPEYADPSYNGVVVAESNELATSLDQYWSDRRFRHEKNLESLKEYAENPAAEREWQNFCRSGGARFLDRYIKAATAFLSSPLRQLWGTSSGLVREAQRAFEKEADAEIWLPLSLFPLQFICLDARSLNAETRELTNFEHPENYALGKPHVMVRWEDKYLFMILPSREYVTLNTFVFTQDGNRWNTEDVLPKAFAEILRQFRPNLDIVEKQFARVRSTLEARRLEEHAKRQLDRLVDCAKAWGRVQIPDAQKLDILRRIELFESGDPAAPYGLLLYGPTGTGKSLIARTIAETADCAFQKLSLPDLKKMELGASGKRVREIWDHARANKPSVIFVDECDSVFGDRGTMATDVVATEVVQAFLPEWDGIQQTSGIMVIGATNRRQVLDPATLSRFGWEMKIELPGDTQRRIILDQELKKSLIELQLPDNIGAFTQGLSGRDLRNVASATKALAYPDRPTIDHLYEAAVSARKRGNAQLSSTESWETLAIDGLNLQRLKLICELLREPERWKSYGVSIPRSLLLTGPDTGLKKDVAQVLSKESGLALIAPTLSDLKNPILGESGKQIKLIFERANSAILFLDRLESVTPNRGIAGAMDPVTNEIIGQLAQECERAQQGDRRVFLLGESSTPRQVDPAVLDCFREEMSIGLPGYEARLKLFSGLLADKKISFRLNDGALLFAQLTENRGLESRDVENLVLAAEQKALQRAIRNGGPEHYSITLDDLGILPPS